MARRTFRRPRVPSLPSGDPILVTGATGFVGSAVLRALAERGESVRVLARPTSPRRNLEGVACEIVEGDMTDAASMARAMQGVRFLYHVAADYRLWARDPGEIRRANLAGARGGDAGGAGGRRREDRLHVQRRHAAAADAATVSTRPRRSPSARRSAPTSRARSPPSGWSSGWSRRAGCRR